MPDIKTRDTLKGTIKTIDKAAVAGERMKDAYIRTKDQAEHGVYSAENSPDEYAADRVTGTVEAVTYEAAHQFDKQGRKSFETTKENIARGKEHWERRKTEKVSDVPEAKEPPQQSQPTPQRQAKRYAREQAEKQMQKKAVQRTRQQTADAIKRSAQSVKATDRGSKTVKQATKSTGHATVKTTKSSVKTTQKAIKTAEQTAKTTVKTTQAAAKTAQQTAQATVKATRAAAQAARAAARTAMITAKAVAKATVTVVKAIIAATKALVSAIMAGGWIAVLIIVVICMIGLLVCSCFGIFFSGEDTGTGQTMQIVVREVNEDYENQLDTIKANVSHDVLEMSGFRAV